MATSLAPQTGLKRLSDQIREYAPDWMDKSPGSVIGSVLAAIGAEDDRIAGDSPDTTLDAGSITGGGVGVLADTSKTWTTNEWQGGNYWAEDQDGTRYKILSNISTILTVDSSVDFSSKVGEAFEIVRIGSQVQNTTFGSQLRTATGRDLEWLAKKYGVYRPDVSTSDASFRAALPLLAWELKLVRPTVEAFLTAFIGDKATFNWDVYCVRPNELIVELAPNPLGSGDATYLLGTTATALTGTLTTAGTVTVTGTGTSFDTELIEGDYITAAGQTRQVVSIAGPTSLDVNGVFSPDLAGASATVPRPSSGSTTNPKSSYMAADDTESGPPTSSPAGLVRNVVLGGEDHGNAGLVKYLLERYIVSAGTVVTVEYRGT